MPLRFEAWTRPGSPLFEKKFDIPVAMPGSAGERVLSDYADEAILVPASYSRLSELAGPTTGSWIRVFHGPFLIDEFDAERVSLTAGRPNTRTVSGVQRNGLIEGIGVAPFGYPDHIPGAFDWIWGGKNLLPPLGLSDLDSIREVWEVHHDATGGTFNVAVDGQNVDIAHDASTGALEGSAAGGFGMQSLSTVNDVSVSGAGTATDPWVITFHDPANPSTVVFDGTNLTGGTLTSTQTTAGALDASPITVAKPIDAGSDEEQHGKYGTPALTVNTSIVNTGADYSVEVDIVSGFGGSQYARVPVVPGRTYSEISVPVRVDANAKVGIIIRDQFEVEILREFFDVTADTWTVLTASEFVAPDGTDEVIFRVSVDDDDTPVTLYTSWQQAQLLEGQAPDTFTSMATQLLEAAQARGAGGWLEVDSTTAADSLGTVLDAISFTVYAGDDVHMGHVMADGRQMGYQWRIVPAEDALVITPQGSTTHVLQIFYINADEVEDLTASPGGPSVTVGGKGVAEAQVVSRRIPYTTLIGLGAGALSAEDTDAAAEAALGRIEKISDVEHLATAASVQKFLDAQFADQARNLKAATATVLETAPRLPLVDYAEGSKIWWQFPGILAKEARPIKRIGWTHGMTARFELQGSRILTGDAALVAAVDHLLRQRGRRRSERQPTQTPSGGGGELSASVAASNATALEREKADYKCNGDDDYSQIAAAIAAATNADGDGGTVVLSSGVFNVGSNQVTISGRLRLVGQGHATQLIGTHATGVVSVSGNGSYLADMQVNADTGNVCVSVGTSAFIERLRVIGNGGIGIQGSLESSTIQDIEGTGCDPLMDLNFNRLWTIRGIRQFTAGAGIKMQRNAIGTGVPTTGTISDVRLDGSGSGAYGIYLIGTNLSSDRHSPINMSDVNCDRFTNGLILEDITDVQISNFQATRSWQHGAVFDDAIRCTLRGNVHSSSQQTDDTYDQVHVTGASERCRFEVTAFDPSSLTNGARYGLFLDTATVDNLESSDLRDSGRTANYLDSGTGNTTTDEHLV